MTNRITLTKQKQFSKHMLLIGLFYIIVPLLLIGIVAFIRQANRLLWIFTVLSFGSVIFNLWLTARWEIVSIYLRPLFPVLFVIACVVGYKRIKKRNTQTKRIVYILNITINTIIIIFISGINWFSIKGYSAP